MGYFSNGSEGLDFRETYCEHCVNLPERDDRDCPVYSAHLAFCYELCNEKKHPGKIILDMLIEREDCSNRCMMFVDKRKPVRTVVDREKDADLAKARPKLIDWEPKA